MPDNDQRRGLRGLMGRVNRSMSSLYQTTYFTSPSNNANIDRLRKDISSNLDDIVASNINTMGIPSVSKLYSRLKFKFDTETSRINGKNGVSKFFDDALNYDDFFAVFQSNRYLMEMDAEIDSTCKYFPDLEEALLVLKEGVLSPDYFSKDFLTLKNLSIGEDDDTTFDERCKDLKKRYNLLPFIEDVYYHASKYGEDFVYIVPYKTALSRLLTDKPYTNPITSANIEHESAIGTDDRLNETFMLSIDNKRSVISDNTKASVLEFASPQYIIESAVVTEGSSVKAGHRIDQPQMQSLLNQSESFHLQVEICRRGIIESEVRNAQVTNKRKGFMESTSAQFFNEVALTEGKKDLKIVKKDKKSGKLVVDGIEEDIDDETNHKNELVSDGLIGFANQRDNRPEITVDVPGCVVSRIKREQVIPIYIGSNNTCLGYYYIELRSYEALEDFRGLNYIMSDSLTSLRGSNSGMNAPFNCVDPSRQEELLKYVAGQLSQFIDKQFIQANQDLREEIYQILKYNDLFNTPAIDKVKITFIPPEDMVHVYFKLDPITHRGISDLDKAMVPAKIYASMYITDAIGRLVRGQDKRVYYVKQQVDTNIAQTLLNVINQVKQGNFGFRQFSNINNVLNITGKFNDLFIPVGTDGNSPIDIQTMPGQQFTDNSEQLEQVKEMAINSIGVPFEIIQSRMSVDYASQLSMANSKFLRKIYARQSVFSPFVSRICTKIYNFEYKENVELEASFPPPVFINTANTNQIAENTKQFVQNVTEFDLANEQDEAIKNEYMRQLYYFYLGTHLDISRHEEILRKAKQLVEVSRKGEEDQQ